MPAGGRRQGGGERGKLSPEKPPPPTLQTDPQFLSKDFLRPGQWRAAPGERVPSLWLPEQLVTEGKGAPCLWRGRTNLWLPGPLAAEGKGVPHPGRVRRGSGCLSRSPRREKVSRTRGEAAKTSGCLAGIRQVLPIHSDICPQHPTLPAAGLN